MKSVVMIGIIAMFSSSVQSCPTCVSSPHDYTPPFFSEDFYLPYEHSDQVKRTKIVDTLSEESHEDNQIRESEPTDSNHQ